jgi:hypothetical protein
VLAWLLAASTGQGQQQHWHIAGEARWTALAVPGAGKTGFRRLSPDQTGITFINELGEFSRAANRVLENGAGVAAGDYDNDGLPDIFFCNLEGANRLYKNLGNWKFKDVSSIAGVVLGNRVSRGAVFADINGDGKLDLLISTLTEAWSASSTMVVACSRILLNRLAPILRSAVARWPLLTLMETDHWTFMWLIIAPRTSAIAGG